MNPTRILTLTAAASLMIALAPTQAVAQSEPLLGQVNLFGTRWCPRNWLPADGSLLPINRYQALFSLFGTTYGGDGRTTFALPDLRARAPVGWSPDMPIGTRSDSAGVSETGLTASPVLAMNWCVAATGIFPSRP